MEKNQRDQTDVENIKKYLETLREFVNFLKPKSNNKSDLITQISTILKYEKIPENRVICKYGEIGQKFYLILQGTGYCLLPDEEKIEMTQQEYFDYLLRLKKFKEKEILNRVVPLNQKVFPLEQQEIAWLKGELRSIKKNDMVVTPFAQFFEYFSYKENPNLSKIDWKIFEDEKYQFSSSRYQQITTVDDYLKNVNPCDRCRIKRKEKKYQEVSVMFYGNVAKLSNGSKFGELALVSASQKRTATVISSNVCHLGILNKKNFLKIIDDVNDKVKKMDIQVLQQQQIFSSINTNVFQWNYFGKFEKKKLKRGDILINEGCDLGNIFVIKEGLFEISLKKNIVDLSEIINKFEENSVEQITEDDLLYGN